MANVNIARGLIPVRDKFGRPYNGQCNLYMAPATYATALFVGDPVIITGTADADGIPEVNVATAGATNKITGVIVGFRPTQATDPVYGPASTLRYIWVSDDPFLIYECQANVTAAVAATDIGTNINLIAGSGSTVTGFSGWQANTTSMASDATYQMTIERLVPRPDNAIDTTAYAKLELSINLSQKNDMAVAGI